VRARSGNLATYAKRTKKADAAAADVMGSVSASALGQKQDWPEIEFRSGLVLLRSIR
jgi:hypothetical protein